ncbi:MAG: ABC transporter permease [Eubacterium sp.]|nr:ABC transporter permease [Eubacterium sp.]
MVLQSFKMAWKSIASNKMRSFLTMLGIIIGVMSLVVLVSLVSGTTDSVQNSISSMGTDLLQVTISDDGGTPIRLDDVEEVFDDDSIGAVAALSQESFTVESGSTSEDATVYGTTSSYGDIAGLEVVTGRFIYNIDNDNHTNVAVISYDIATEILGTANAVGSEISINGTTFTVVGILENDDDDTNSVYEVYIPYTTLIRQSSSVTTEVSSIVISAADGVDVDETESAVETILYDRFGDEDAYSIMSSSTIEEAMESVTNTLALLLGGIAAISLLVGGIGIMNIMLVSVTERTREIGIRKAIGAGRGVIMLQFLIESLMVSLMGCGIGIAGSWIALRIASVVAANNEYDLSFTMSMGVVWASVAFSVAIGVIFGLYPANKAAKKNPIEALRYMG